MSAFVPGLGQIYSTHYRDGIRHFLFNALLGYWLYRLIDDENAAGALLVGGVELPFYVGNVLGAGRSARRYNASCRAQYLSDALRAVEP
jgi:hypothetical protein